MTETTRLTLDLSESECAALDRFLTAHPGDLSAAEGAHLLLRDALVGIGELPPARTQAPAAARTEP